MKALTYLLIAVVGLAFAAGVIGCGEPPDYECEACGLEWGVADFGGYKEHMEAEHGKSFFCEEEVTKPSGEVGPCGEAFASAAELDEHMVIVHSEPPDYECEACGEPFASTAELEEHSATHGP